MSRVKQISLRSVSCGADSFGEFADASQYSMNDSRSSVSKVVPANNDAPASAFSAPAKPIAILLQHASLFHFGDTTLTHDRVIASGFPALDAALSGGWPVARLTELLCDHTGVGELSLLLPVLPKQVASKEHSSIDATDKRRALWISQIALPAGLPCVAYAPALERAGIDLRQLVIANTTSAQQTLWAMEQALLSGATRAVFAWIHEHPHDFSLRRIAQAARKSESLCFLMRPRTAEKRASPAELRLALAPATHAANGALNITLLKRRGLLRELSLSIEPRVLPCLAADRVPIVSPTIVVRKHSLLVQAATKAPLSSTPKVRERSLMSER